MDSHTKHGITRNVHLVYIDIDTNKYKKKTRNHTCEARKSSFYIFFIIMCPIVVEVILSPLIFEDAWNILYSTHQGYVCL